MRYMVVVALLLAAAAAPLAAQEPVRILFVGNSLTADNDLPRMVCSLIRAGGGRATCEMVAFANFALEDHLAEGSALKKLGRGRWDWVVFQQGSSALESSRESLIRYARSFRTAIPPGTRTAWLAVWPAASRAQDFPRVSESYRMAAEAVQGTFIPAGDAWVEAWKTDSNLALYGEDRFHPSQLGSYLAAMTVYRVLVGELPGVFSDPATARSAARLKTDAETIRTIVDAVNRAVR